MASMRCTTWMSRVSYSSSRSQPKTTNCCCRSAIPAWDCPGTRQIRSLTPSLPPRLTAPAWDFASAARLSNRMVAACGLPTTLHAAQVFVSPYPPEPKQMKTHEVAPALSVIHEAAAGREAIQGGNATNELNYRTDFVTPADR